MSIQDWSISRPWATLTQRGAGGGRVTATPTREFPGNSFIKKGQQPSTSYESHFKRCIPYVTLALDESRKNVIIDSTDDNVYIKVPECSVSVTAILAAVGQKVSIPPDDLVLLDSKIIPVSNEKGQLIYYV